MKTHWPSRVWSIAAAASCVSAFAASRPVNDFNRVPLTFEANAGQADARVKYLSRGSGYTLYLTADNEAVLSLSRPTQKGDRESAAVRMRMPGSTPASAIEATDEKATVSNYIHGSDPKRWRMGLKHYGRVSYKSIYPGIDAVYYGNQRQLEYDFVVAPGADPNAIRVKFDGADRITKDAKGDLLLHTSLGPIRQLKPIVYQEEGGRRQYVAASYKLHGNEARFALGAYDRSRPLIIDPVLVYSSFLGGTGVENGSAIALDGNRSAYVAGSTASTDFPITAAIAGQGTFRGGALDAFITKYSPDGNAVVFSTYIGGSGSDSATGVAVDATGAILVAGQTDSTNFPLRNALQPSIGGKVDAFLMKIGSDGLLVWSTYIGGFEDDATNALVVDANNNAIVVGATFSTNFWASGGYQPAFFGGATDGWIFKMNPDGLRQWSTYLGGSGNDAINDVAVDNVGDIYVTGETTSLGFPNTAGAFRNSITSVGISDAFVTKFAAAGGLLRSTYLGGSSSDRGMGIAVDVAKNIYVTGDTNSVNFPTLGTLQGPPGNGDVFVTKMNDTATGLIFSTYLAGSGVDNVADIALDSQSNVYVYGSTTSENLPVIRPLQSTLSGGSVDLFVAQINAAGTARLWVTYLGGIANESAAEMAIDTNANLYLTGSTASVNYPRFGTAPSELRGAQDAFVTKISGCDITLVPGAATFGPAATTGSFTVNAVNCPWIANVSDTWITITSAASGMNTSVVTYSIGPNAGTARTGYISVSGVRFNITQSGLTTVAPTVVSLTPNAGTGNSQIFTGRYSTANPGGATIDRAYLLLNTTISGTNGCLVEYTPATNAFRVINDNGATWSAPAVAGTNTTLSNSQCTLNLGSSSGSVVAGTGVLETVVNYSLSFTAGFNGAKNVYLLANSESSGLTSGWVQGGTWTVATGQTGGSNGVASLVPTTGSGFSGVFSGTFTHTGGATQHYLGYMLFLPTPNVVNYNATGTCLIEYNRISNGMRLIDNAGTGWLGGVSGIPLGTVGATLSNNYCTVSVQNATAVVSGNTMVVTVPVQFQPTLGPVLGTFLQAQDVNGVWTGMTQFGNWVLPGAPPVRPGPGVIGIAPTSAAGSSVTYSISARHPNGAAGMTQVHMLISDRIVGGQACHVIYFPPSNTLNLVNDNGSALVSAGGVTPGTSAFLANSRCTVNTAASVVTAAGTDVTISIPMTFNALTFGGAKGVYGNVFDLGGLTSHWVQGATLIVQ